MAVDVGDDAASSFGRELAATSDEIKLSHRIIDFTPVR